MRHPLRTRHPPFLPSGWALSSLYSSCRMGPNFWDIVSGTGDRMSLSFSVSGGGDLKSCQKAIFPSSPRLLKSFLVDNFSTLVCLYFSLVCISFAPFSFHFSCTFPPFYHSLFIFSPKYQPTFPPPGVEGVFQ